MSIDRSLWLKPLTNKKIPAWSCPRCGDGVLVLSADHKGVDRFCNALDAESHHDRELPPNACTGVFAAILKCHHPDCAESVCASGKHEVVEDYDFDKSFYFERCYPLVFYPPIHLFRIPETCPDSIRDETIAAFQLFWLDTNSCLNRIRSAIELLLTEMGIARTEIVHNKKQKKNERRRLSLARRITFIPKQQQELIDALNALRWLGNAGTHSGTVSKDDAFDGFDLLQHVLSEKYDKHHVVIGALSKAINKKKGPRKK